MCGGEKAAFERAKPVMDSYGRAVTLLGEPGAGQLTKMVNQICIAGLVQALSEGIAFAEKAGLEAGDLVGTPAVEALERSRKVPVGHEVLGERLQHLVGVQRVEVLRPIPA